MRAVCETCGAAQPLDWSAGDLCSACGAAVRRDVRCFWCAKWTPPGKFCRSCGAAVVEDALYGAARMLKDAGTDRFSIPKLLRELDRDQIENFTRIYQRHAALVERHVDDVRFLERFLHHRDFSAALEDSLVPQLPWPEETLERLDLGPRPAGGDLETAQAIAETTPFPLTKSLSSLVRLVLGDGKAWTAAAGVFRADDGALRAEAALVLTGWRIWAGYGRPRQDLAEIIDELRSSPFRLEAAVRLGLLGQRDEALLREALDSRDPETAFAAAVALDDVDRLQAALQGDDLQKSVAGSALIRLGVLKAVERVIEKSPLEVQTELVESVLRRKEPAPELGETLLGIVETTDDARLRERAARALCRGLRPEWALRIARAAGKDRHIFQSLLSEEAALPPETLSEVAAHLLDAGLFTSSQYGLTEAAQRGSLPDGFVPSRFAQSDDEVRRELLRVAEAQLGARMDESLHRFVMGVVFGPYPAKTRAAAWWALSRTYCHDGDPRGEGPFRLSKKSIERFFGPVRTFLPMLADVLRDRDTLKEVGVYEFLADLFSSAEPDFLPDDEDARDLVRAVLEAVRGDYWPGLVDGMIRFLGAAGTCGSWRGEAIAGLEALGKKGNYYWEKTLRTLRLSEHGLPDEPEWKDLPEDFVPSRFASASEETRALLLRVADEQLIHHQPPAVARWLLDVAFGPYTDALRLVAMERFDDRARGVKASFAELLPGLGEVLRRPALLKDRLFGSFVQELLKDADPAALLAEEDAGESVVRALLDLAASGDRDLHNIRLYGIRLLGKVRDAGRWKDAVASGLCALRDTKGFDFASECERILPREPERVRPVPSRVEPEAANPWEAKQKEAERLGRELQEAALRISFGTDSPEEKTRRIMALQAEFQARIKELYGC
jgi:hypothetical protein